LIPGNLQGSFTSTNVISAYHYQGCEFDSTQSKGVLDTTLYHEVSY